MNIYQNSGSNGKILQLV